MQEKLVNYSSAVLTVQLSCDWLKDEQAQEKLTKLLCYLPDFIIDDIVVVFGWNVERVAFFGCELSTVNYNVDFTLQNDKDLKK